MSEEIKEKWEDVSDATIRLKVPCGWIYKSVTNSGGVALVFVPHPDFYAKRGKMGDFG